MMLIDKFNNMFRSHQANSIFIAIDDTDKSVLDAKVVNIPPENIIHTEDGSKSVVLFELEDDKFERFKESQLIKFKNAPNQDKRRFLRFDIEDSYTIPKVNKRSHRNYVQDVFLPFAEEAQIPASRDTTFEEELKTRKYLLDNISPKQHKISPPMKLLSVKYNLKYFLLMSTPAVNKPKQKDKSIKK